MLTDVSKLRTAFNPQSLAWTAWPWRWRQYKFSKRFWGDIPFVSNQDYKVAKIQSKYNYIYSLL